MLACGRRWGKTILGEDVLIEPALRGYPVAWFSPTYKMLTEVWRAVKGALHPAVVRVSEQEHRLELGNGGVIDMWSLDAADTVRGRKYKRVVVDEAAMDGDLLAHWQNVIRPTLTDYRGDAWFLSTPNGLNGFWTLYQQGQDPSQPDWRSWQAPTTDNPYIDPAEVEAARADLPEQVYAQEYGAEFLADGSNVFRRVLEAATATPAPREAGHRYVMGLDWGALNDFTVISVIDATKRRQVALDRFNRIDLHFQADRVQALYDRYKPDGIIAETNGIGLPNVQHLQSKKLPIVPWESTNARKNAVVRALALAFERGNLAILSDADPLGRVQRAELLAYQTKRLPSGVLTFGAPEGMHDDTVIALMLAWLGCLQANGRAIDFEVRPD